MTCASCAARIEKKPDRLDGVIATVNLATERATVSLAGSTSPAELITVVEQAGYTAALPAPSQAGSAGTDRDARQAAERGKPDALLRRLLVSLALTIPVVVLAMVPPTQFRDWQWLSLTLASPVAVWGAWPFHRAAFVNARHGAPTIDTLISQAGQRCR